MSDLRGTFRKPFAEQIAAFRIRLANQVPTQAWDDLLRAQHDQAFVVAGAQQADLLADLAEAVRRSVEDGETFETFKKDFRQIVEKRGWHGWTGEGSLRGEEWRMRTIYQTNLRTSYMAGRHAQLTAGNFRYWVYRHSGAAHPRLDHLSWDGLALAPDDPFWATHYPPNGWGCGCKVRGANSARSVERLGGDLSKVKPDGWNGRDPRTGAPPGIDKLWDYAPGASVSNAILAVSEKLDRTAHPLAIDVLRSWIESPMFARWMTSPSGDWPVLRLPDEIAERLGSKVRIARMSPQTAAKQRDRHPELTAADYAAAQATADDPDEVLFETNSETGTRSVVLISAPDARTGQTVVVKSTVSGQGLFVTSLRRLTSDIQMRQAEIERLRRKAQTNGGGRGGT